MSDKKDNELNTAPLVGKDYDTYTHIDAITDNAGHSTGTVLNDGYTDDLQPTLSGRLPDGDGQVLRVYCNGNVIGYTTIGDGGNWTFAPETPLEPGKQYDFQVFLLDASNDNSLWPSNTYTIHTTALDQDAAPVAPVITEVHDQAGDHQGVVAQGGKTDDGQPLVSGTADAGSVVTVKVHAAGNDRTYTLGSVVADADGHWSYQLHGSQNITNLHGEWTFTATATNAMGTSDTSAGYSVETVASNADVFATPEISYIVDDVGLHQGHVTDGGKTDDKQPELHGTGEPGSVVTVTMYGPSTGKTYTLGRVTVGNDGTWHYQFTGKQAMQAGHGAENIFHVSSVDTDGHTVTSDAFTVTLTGSNADDNTPPDITPPDTPNIYAAQETNDDGTQHGVKSGGTTEDSTPELLGAAEPDSIVTIYDGAVVIGSVAADSEGNWTYDVSQALADGKHTFTVTATDAAGNTSDHSPSYTLDVETADTTPPDAPIITEVYDDQGLTQGPVANGGKTDDSLLKISGTAEHDSIVVISHVIESTGTTYIDGSVVADASGHWVFDMTGPFQPTFGNRIITATATDAAGNTSAPSDSYVVNYVGTNQDGTLPPGVSGSENFDGINLISLPDDFTTDSGLRIQSTGTLEVNAVPPTMYPLDDHYNYLYVHTDTHSLFTLPGACQTLSFDYLMADNVIVYDTEGHVLTTFNDLDGSLIGLGWLAFNYTAPEGTEIGSFSTDGAFIDNIVWSSPDAAVSHSLQSLALPAASDSEGETLLLSQAMVESNNHSSAHADMTDGVHNTLHLTLNDILSEAHPNLFVQDGKQQLAVTGDQGDVVELKVDDLAHNTWQDSGAVTAGGIQYEVYQHAGSDVELLVQHGLELHQVA